MVAYALLQAHGTHMQLSSQSHPTTPLLQVGGFMLPFVVVGGCIVVLTLIMMVIVHSAGITICDVSSPYTSTAFSMGCSSCLSMLCPVESTRRTLSFQVLLGLLTNIMIVLLGKSFNCHVLIIPWTVHSNWPYLWQWFSHTFSICRLASYPDCFTRSLFPPVQ